MLSRRSSSAVTAEEPTSDKVLSRFFEGGLAGHGMWSKNDSESRGVKMGVMGSGDDSTDEAELALNTLKLSDAARRRGVRV